MVPLNEKIVAGLWWGIIYKTLGTSDIEDNSKTPKIAKTIGTEIATEAMCGSPKTKPQDIILEMNPCY